ncbi:MAG: hypothetical protein AB4062_06770 [Crocosphaera sp.]
MARSKILRVRLSDEEWARLESYAKSKDYTLTEVIRDYIKRLPKVDFLRSIILLVAIHLTVNLLSSV